ncbi:hypothetical protein HU200_007757 [Digitaria exilis]|uniref:Peptidase S54 rhomboid domain-containing protein n=1 Tax=Digitaria exilis TaxID=1010633 RepID=A0A835KQT9_9POAL|nr:hypothetical protein HU200_007757 [Digitaria exilis]
MRRKLLQFPSLLAQHALRGAPKPQLQPHHHHHHRLLHSPTAPSSASLSPSPSAELLWSRLAAGAVASLLPWTAAAARTAANRWLAAARGGGGGGSLDLFSLQRGGRTGGSVWQFVSSTYLKPWAYWLRMRPDGMVLTLIGANVTVFMLWRVADQGFMRRHFTNSLDNFKSGRLHTLLTSAFTHIETSQLFSNMIGLYFFGTSVSYAFLP